MDYASQGISCQIGYFRSIPGILKIIELVNILHLFKTKKHNIYFNV